MLQSRVSNQKLLRRAVEQVFGAHSTLRLWSVYIILHGSSIKCYRARSLSNYVETHGQVGYLRKTNAFNLGYVNTTFSYFYCNYIIHISNL